MNLQLSSEWYETGTIHLPKCDWLMAALSDMNEFIQNTCLQAGNRGNCSDRNAIMTDNML